jgi:hypothetical protein
MTPEEAMVKAPAQIKRVKVEAYEAKNRAERVRFRLKLLEADIAGRIASALTEDGKPAFRNAEARDAAVRRHLQDNAEAAALRREVADEEALAMRIQAHGDYLEDVQRNARVLLLSRSPANLVFEEATP